MDELSAEEYRRKQTWFEEYVAKLDAQPNNLPLRCPCCGYKTLSERAAFDICPVCFWEDDGQDDHDADQCRGGPNGSLRLREARENYKAFGASQERLITHVRLPRQEERP